MAGRTAIGLLLAGILLALAGCQGGDDTSSSGRVKGFYGSVGGGWNQQ